MQKQITKRYPAIACCGIDCGLCPRHYTAGASKCPGCAGAGFFEKHPACSILTCCVKANGWETCAGCPQFPCEKFKNWDIVDSFVTHQKSLENLRQIRDTGIVEFLEQQEERIRLLDKLLKQYDDGRSKSFFCLAAALMETDDLHAAISQIQDIQESPNDRRQLASQAKGVIEQLAKLKGVKLVYRR
jgi:hypothetical protein